MQIRPKSTKAGVILQIVERRLVDITLLADRRDLLGVGHPVALDVQVVLADWRQIQETLGDGKVQIDQAEELGAAFPAAHRDQISRDLRNVTGSRENPSTSNVNENATING